MSIIKRIPSYVIDIILSFDGRIVNRNGVYIDRIPKNDVRYKILYSIPSKEFENNKMSVEMTIDDNKYFVLCSDIFQNRNRIYLLVMEDYEVLNNNIKYGVRHLSTEEYFLS